MYLIPSFVKPASDCCMARVSSHRGTNTDSDVDNHTDAKPYPYIGTKPGSHYHPDVGTKSGTHYIGTKSGTHYIGTKSGTHYIGTKLGTHYRPDVGPKPGTHYRPDVGPKLGTHYHPDVGTKSGIHHRPDISSKPCFYIAHRCTNSTTDQYHRHDCGAHIRLE
jgi:hypothetical protein